MRPIPRVWVSASVAAAATEVRDSGLPAVAVTEGFLYVAIVTQESLATALAQGVDPNDSISHAYDARAVTLPPYAPLEKALDLFANHGATAIPVVDDYGRLMGVITPADLFPKRDRVPRPPAVGGMATPFGVYLTTGIIGAGATGWSLVATGAVMSSILLLTQIIAASLQKVSVAHHWNIPADAFGVLAYFLFLSAFRFIPLSGIHAAEHKVVHAIERGEELTRENVRRMPRVHPRCGTNIAVGASILMGLFSIGATALSGIDKKSEQLIPDLGFVIIGSVIATLILWRPIGSLVQSWFTTREPTDSQIDMGIRSGEELLKRYATGPGGRTGFMWRIWNSGIFHVMAGASATMGVITLLDWGFQLHIPGLS